ADDDDVAIPSLLFDEPVVAATAQGWQGRDRGGIAGVDRGVPVPKLGQPVSQTATASDSAGDVFSDRVGRVPIATEMNDDWRELADCPGAQVSSVLGSEGSEEATGGVEFRRVGVGAGVVGAVERHRIGSLANQVTDPTVIHR